MHNKRTNSQILKSVQSGITGSSILDSRTNTDVDSNGQLKGCYLQPFFFPSITLWKRDKTYILFFIVVNIIMGQIGFLTSMLLTWQNGGDQLNAWRQNLGSAALFTFSVSLVASCVALIGSEFLDAFRSKREIHLLEQKASWSLIAIAVLALQAPMVGSLLSNPPSSSTHLATIAATESLEKKPLTMVVPVTDSTVALHPSIYPQSQNSVPSHTAQVLFWLVSMFVALQLFCLSRIHLIPNRYAENRNEDVRAITVKAENQTKTAFDEKL